MGPRDAVTMARIEAAQQEYQVQKDKYERLRSDVTIKLKFLEENKVSVQDHHHQLSKWKHLDSTPCVISHVSNSQVKVMHKQLLLFHNAISAYFAGNQQQLEQTLKQFNIKLRPPGADKPSWLEEQWEALLDLIQPPPHYLLNPPTYKDHYRRKHMQITGRMKASD